MPLDTPDRRQFLKTLSLTPLAFGAGSGLLAADAPSKRKFVVVGLGSRSRFFLSAMTGPYRDEVSIIAFCDTNAGRLALAQGEVTAAGLSTPAAYPAADFGRMLKECRPDVVIVTTPDATHDGYIIQALDFGCDVITEKPMTTTPAKCQAILDACARSGRDLRVSFNYRYSPARTQVKEMLMAGRIGDVLSVDFQWNLNTHHGADYFRRWHGEKKNSGGLLTHKSTHHFDLVNWWLGAVPVHVNATGKREFYTPTMAKRLGLKSHHERCRTCPEGDVCGFKLDLSEDAKLRRMYLENEHHDGYFRDQCVFNPRIDIEDTMNVQVTYDTGTTLNYSLNAFCSWEGYTIAFNGTAGRIEHTIVEKVYVAGSSDEQGASAGTRTRLIPLRGPAEDLVIPMGEGGHGGGDPLLLEDIFSGKKQPDPTGRASDQFGGAYSILIGAAANESLADGHRVYIDRLVTGLKRPRYAPMPSRQDPVPMPARRRKA